MKNRTFKHFVTWLLIASPLWWTTGCRSTREFTRLDELPRPEIEVVTKGNAVYEFTEWTYDSLMGISGESAWIDKSLPVWYSRYSEGHISLARDSIKSVTVEGKDTLPADSIDAIKPREVLGIEITTKGSTVYTFEKWRFTKTGGIEGLARTRISSHQNWYDYGSASAFKKIDVTVPADSVASVRISETSAWTILVVACVLISGCAVALHQMNGLIPLLR
jgi:hypothetical protein